MPLWSGRRLACSPVPCPHAALPNADMTRLTRRRLACSVAAAIWIERSSGSLLAAGGGADAAGGDDVAPLAGGERFSKAAFDYYMDLWKLFYAAYLLLPLAL